MGDEEEEKEGDAMGEDDVVFVSRNSAVRFEEEVEGDLRRTSGVNSAAMERLCINADDDVIIRSSLSPTVADLNRRLKRLEDGLKEKEEIISNQIRKAEEAKEELEAANARLNEKNDTL